MTSDSQPPHPTRGMTVKGRKDWSALGIFLAEIHELFPWYTGMRLDGFNVKFRETDVLLIVKATGRAGKFVAFYSGESQVVILRLLWGDLHRGTIRWRPDKF